MVVLRVLEKLVNIDHVRVREVFEDVDLREELAVVVLEDCVFLDRFHSPHNPRSSMNNLDHLPICPLT